MRKILIAASLIAGMASLTAANVAHADAFNGQAQRSIAANQGTTNQGNQATAPSSAGAYYAPQGQVGQ